MPKKSEISQTPQAGQPGTADDSLTVEVENRIRDFVARNLLFSENGFPYENNDSFLRRGVIDSLGVIELVAFVEREFQASIAPAEITPQNFDSVSQLVAFVRRKTSDRKEPSYAGP